MNEQQARAADEIRELNKLLWDAWAATGYLAHPPNGDKEKAIFNAFHEVLSQIRRVAQTMGVEY